MTTPQTHQHFMLTLTSGQGSLILNEKTLEEIKSRMHPGTYYFAPFSADAMTPKEIKLHNLKFSTLVGFMDAIHGHTYGSLLEEGPQDDQQELTSLLLG